MKKDIKHLANTLNKMNLKSCWLKIKFDENEKVIRITREDDIKIDNQK